MTWIQTYTGKQFYPLAPDGAAVCIEDIAHALSMKCRFTGHCLEFYSVAEHSVMVLNRVRELGGAGDTLRAALLHDAAEAYLPDVARPIKGLTYFADPDTRVCDAWKFSEVENAIMACILGTLDVGCGPVVNWPLIKQADNELLATERRDLMSNSVGKWDPLPAPLERVRLHRRLGHCWHPKDAERHFLISWQMLQERAL